VVRNDVLLYDNEVNQEGGDMATGILEGVHLLSIAIHVWQGLEPRHAHVRKGKMLCRWASDIRSPLEEWFFSGPGSVFQIGRHL